MVTVLETTSQLIKARNEVTDQVGFVPTMGNLHAGHISLLERALSEFSVVVVSIFVNPKQFGPSEDFTKYPRTLKEDLNLVERLSAKFPNSKVIVYAPKGPQEVFPEGQAQTVSVVGLSSIIEGKFRPGHFDGVTTVVYRLFELVRPERAYFGLKDYQQFVVIRQMVEDLGLPVELTGMPTIREPSGLALSSRNQYLSEIERNEALALSQGLKEVASVMGGKKEKVSSAMKKIEEITKDDRWNYLELRDADTLSADIGESERVVLLGVFQLGKTRLLDNLLVEIE